MINKKTFIFNTLAEALTFKIGADPKKTTYRLGSFAFRHVRFASMF